MGSKTVSLEDSAYEKLKAVKRPGESFSDVVHRLTAERRPSLLQFTKIMTPEEGQQVADAVAEMRRIDKQMTRQRMASMQRKLRRGR